MSEPFTGYGSGYGYTQDPATKAVYAYPLLSDGDWGSICLSLFKVVLPFKTGMHTQPYALYDSALENDREREAIYRYINQHRSWS